jgi:hypothetical protein
MERTLTALTGVPRETGGQQENFMHRRQHGC